MDLFIGAVARPLGEYRIIFHGMQIHYAELLQNPWKLVDTNGAKGQGGRPSACASDFPSF